MDIVTLGPSAAFLPWCLQNFPQHFILHIIILEKFNIEVLLFQQLSEIQILKVSVLLHPESKFPISDTPHNWKLNSSEEAISQLNCIIFSQNWDGLILMGEGMWGLYTLWCNMYKCSKFTVVYIVRKFKYLLERRMKTLTMKYKW